MGFSRITAAALCPWGSGLGDTLLFRRVSEDRWKCDLYPATSCSPRMWGRAPLPALWKPRPCTSRGRWGWPGSVKAKMWSGGSRIWFHSLGPSSHRGPQCHSGQMGSYDHTNINLMNILSQRVSPCSFSSFENLRCSRPMARLWGTERGFRQTFFSRFL